MKLDDLHKHLDDRLNKIEDKLDNHLERLYKTETTVSYIEGYAKLSIGLFISALTAVVGTLYNMVIK